MRAQPGGEPWASPLPSQALQGPRTVSQRASRQKCPDPPGLTGTFPAPRPAGQHPGTLRDPGSDPSTARVLLADLWDGDQGRVFRAAGTVTVSRSCATGRVATSPAQPRVHGVGTDCGVWAWGAAHAAAGEGSMLMQGVMIRAYAGY